MLPYGGTLDHVYTRSDDNILGLNVDPCGVISDHSFIDWRQPVILCRSSAARKTVRSWKKVDREQFRHALHESKLCGDLPHSLSPEDMFNMYDDELRRLADRFAPETTLKVTRRQRIAVWYDDESRQNVDTGEPVLKLIELLGSSRRKSDTELIGSRRAHTG